MADQTKLCRSVHRAEYQQCSKISDEYALEDAARQSQWVLIQSAESPFVVVVYIPVPLSYRSTYYEG
ncbi:MAG: hypothetical protein OEY58_19670 [Gammaproteobacteria bacterium]|nr:hypothetical protein [Gammaproteobacteria bacterium]